MKLEIDVKDGYKSDNLGDFNLKFAQLEIYTDFTDGRKSELISIGLSNQSGSENEEPTLSFDINRNQASYLYHFLKAFLNEQEQEIDQNISGL